MKKSILIALLTVIADTANADFEGYNVNQEKFKIFDETIKPLVVNQVYYIYQVIDKTGDKKNIEMNGHCGDYFSSMVKSHPKLHLLAEPIYEAPGSIGRVMLDYACQYAYPENQQQNKSAQFY